MTSLPLRRLPTHEGRQSDAPLPPEIVAGARRGDDDAWEALYVRYAGRLLAFLMMKLSHADDAHEALSETWLRAIEKIGSFRGEPDSLRPWLFAIGRNVATDRLRARQRVGRAPDPDAMANVVDLTALDVDEGIISVQERAAVTKAMASLPEDDREVLWLRFGQGMTSDEVAKVVHKKAGAVRMQQMRALQALAEVLER